MSTNSSQIAKPLQTYQYSNNLNTTNHTNIPIHTDTIRENDIVTKGAPIVDVIATKVENKLLSEGNDQDNNNDNNMINNIINIEPALPALPALPAMPALPATNDQVDEIYGYAKPNNNNALSEPSFKDNNIPSGHMRNVSDLFGDYSNNNEDGTRGNITNTGY